MLFLQEELNSSYQKFYSYFSNGDNEHFFNTILKFVKKGVLYPLSYYDGDWFGKNAVNSFWLYMDWRFKRSHREN